MATWCDRHGRSTPSRFPREVLPSQCMLRALFVVLSFQADFRYRSLMIISPITSSQIYHSVSSMYIGLYEPFNVITSDNQPQVTEILQGLLNEDYNYDSTVSRSQRSRLRLPQNLLSRFRIVSVLCIGPSLNVALSKMREILSSIKTETVKLSEFSERISLPLVLGSS